MARVPNFYSTRESSKPPSLRIYHNNDNCRHCREIPLDERRSGTGGYDLCGGCAELNRDEMLIAASGQP